MVGCLKVVVFVEWIWFINLVCWVEMWMEFFIRDLVEWLFGGVGFDVVIDVIDGMM